MDAAITAETPLAVKPTIPTRAKPYADVFGNQPFLVKHSIGRFVFPKPREWDDMRHALMQGDALMDAWVAHMFANSPRVAKQQFETALHHGIDAVLDAPAALKKLFAEVDAEPRWLDRSQFRLATDVMQRAGLTSNYVLRDVALMGGYLLSDFNQALVLTGALQKGARQRMAETSKWWLEVTERGGMSRFSAGFKSTLHVRFVHALVRRHLPSKPEWQMQTWGLPINQIDMMATNSAFSNIYLMALRAFGVPVSLAEGKAVMHLWKYVGWLMGIEETWLRDDEFSANIMVYRAFQTFHKPDWTSEALGKALAEEIKEHTLHHLKDKPRLHNAMIEFIYQLHLSNSALFLRPKQREQLGLPRHLVPWFPAVTMLPRFGKFVVGNLSQKRKQKQILEGRRKQELTVSYMFGDNEHKLIEPDLQHVS